MKHQVAAVALVAAAGAYARKVPVSYTTVTYDDCPSEAPETMITVTAGITVTYCPKCDSEETIPPTPGYTTTYKTTYQSLCPTGMVPATHTITESCPEPTPTWTPGPSHVPQGYTVTTKHCSACKTPGPVTVTEPCNCEAHEGTPGPPAPKPPAPTTPPSGGSSPPSPPETECSEMEDGQPNCSSPPGSPPSNPESPPSSPESPPSNPESPPSSPESPPSSPESPPSSPESPPSEGCSQLEDGQPQCSAPSGAPAPSGKPGAGSPAPPYPTPAGTSPGGRIAQSGTMPAGVSPLPSGSEGYGGGKQPEAPNSASSISTLAGLTSSVAAIIVAALAFAL